MVVSGSFLRCQEAYLGKLYHTLGCLGDATAWEKAKTYFEAVSYTHLTCFVAKQI